MNKKPILLRTLLAIITMVIFGAAMYPLTPKNFYETFTGLLKDRNDPVAAELIADAKARQAKDRDIFESQALLAAADEKGVNLANMIKGEDLENNRDAMSLIRKKASSSIRLGLDLNGGVEFYLELLPDEDKKEEIENDFKHYRDVAIEQLRKRLEQMKIFEAELAPSGERHIVLRAPIVTNDEKAKLRDMIQMSAKLHFRLVESATPEELARYKADPNSVPPGTEYMEYTAIENGKPVVRGYLIATRPEMDGKNIDKARAMRDQMGQRSISLTFNSQGAEDFKRVTENNVGRQLAIVLDGKLYCAPNINEAIAGGSASISGSFTDEESQTIANALQAGNFPFAIKVGAVFDTDPKLGLASVKNGVWVGVISLIFVALFMVIYYRLSGLLAVFALGLNMLLILGAMAAFDCTLTLPGIAGIVLTIGMAVDANVLVFERIREELAIGKKARAAVDAGYDRALSSVLDANITTLITAFILMYVGTGAIKGFAITLCIGILSSLFTALFVTRLVYDYFFRFGNVENLTMLQMLKKTNIDFIKNWKYALAFSGALILLCIIMLGIRGKGVLGIDFTGGTSITYSYVKKGNTSAMVKVLKEAGFQEPSVTYKSNVTADDADREKLEVMLRDDSNETVQQQIGKLLAEKFPECGINPASAHAQHLDGLIGKEFTKAALIAIVLALIGIGAYIVLRYEFTYAIASVLALFHDVLVVLAIYLVSGKTIGLTTVAAFLTVIGYSINDTVVIFDRVRENNSLEKFGSLAENVNLSINQTLSRTLITTLTTFIVVFVLWLAGGPDLQEFTMVMMLGVLLGTYSSVCLAGPMVNFFEGIKARKGAK